MRKTKNKTVAHRCLRIGVALSLALAGVSTPLNVSMAAVIPLPEMPREYVA